MPDFLRTNRPKIALKRKFVPVRNMQTRHNLFVTDTYIDEAISGKGSKTQARKQYQRLLRDCERAKFDTILIHKYDRIARNLGEHVNLEAKLKSGNTTNRHSSGFRSEQ